jgi:hypothetical protein
MANPLALDQVRSLEAMNRRLMDSHGFCGATWPAA